MSSRAASSTLRQAVRSLRRSPGLALVAVATLALGVGANTAIFSVVWNVLLRPLPFTQADRLVRVLGVSPEAGRVDAGPISYPEALDLRQRVHSLSGVAIYDEWGPVLTGVDQPARLLGASVSANFFDVLGVVPAAGRFFTPAEDVPGHEPVVVLGWGLWQSAFGGNPAVVGSHVQFNGTRYAVAGVAPRGFEDPLLSDTVSYRPAVWRATPAYFNPQDMSRTGFAMTAVARLAPGVSLAAAAAEVGAVAEALRREHPDTDHGRGLQVVGLREQIVGDLRPALVVLLAAVGLVALIACANVANLLLLRGAGRQHEMAVRAALGASASRLLRGPLAEGLLLGIAGTVMGIGLAPLALRALVRLGGGGLPRLEGIGLHLPVLLYAAGLGLVVSLLSSVTPALRARRAAPFDALRRAADVGNRTVSRLGRLLVGAEMALATLLLVGAGLLLHSLSRLESVDLGLRGSDVLTFSTGPFAATAPDLAQVRAFWAGLEERLGALPAVSAVGATTILPAQGDFSCDLFTRDDRPKPAPAAAACAETRIVTPGFLGVVGTPLRAGRGLSTVDREGASPVVVVDEVLSARFFPGENPLGKRITTHGGSREIVGVVAGVRQFGAAREAPPSLYLPVAQEQRDNFRQMSVTVKTAGDPLALVGAVREAVRTADPNAPVDGLETLSAALGRQYAEPRFRGFLLGLFAALATLLGGVGVASVIGAAVARRTREMGVRLALGAAPRDLLRLVLGEGLATAGAGLAVGLILAALLARLAGALLFGVDPLDLVSFLAAPGVLLLAALVGALVPAWRAARVDPAVALRQD